MSSEEVSNLALAPMVRFFTYAVIKSMKNKNLEHRKFVIDTDMVPRVSQRVFQASLGERIIIPEHSQPELKSMDVEHSFEAKSSNGKLIQSFGQGKVLNDSAESVKPDNKIPLSDRRIQESFNRMQTPKPMPPVSMNESMPPASKQDMIPPASKQDMMPPAPRQDMMPPAPRQDMMPPAPMNEPMPPAPMPSAPGQHIEMGFPDDSNGELTQFYGKITPLLNDPSVSVIECAGEGKSVMIVRAGQKQPTRIVLSGKDISQILEKISEVAHIPIMEGVFRAAVDTFSVNAVVSEMIGSRFVIRKTQGPGPMGPPR